MGSGGRNLSRSDLKRSVARFRGQDDRDGFQRNAATSSVMDFTRDTGEVRFLNRFCYLIGFSAPGVGNGLKEQSGGIVA